MQLCKYASICKYASMHIYANMWVCKYTSMQVCKYACTRVWEYASKQLCNYTQDKFMKALGEVSSHCEIFFLNLNHQTKNGKTKKGKK